MCELTSNPTTQIKELNELDTNEIRRQNVQDTVYARINSIDSQTVVFQKTLLKLNFVPGSKESMEFLESLNSIPATNDIHSSKVIDQILDYKFLRVRNVAIF